MIAQLTSNSVVSPYFATGAAKPPHGEVTASLAPAESTSVLSGSADAGVAPLSSASTRSWKGAGLVAFLAMPLMAGALTSGVLLAGTAHAEVADAEPSVCVVPQEIAQVSAPGFPSKSDNTSAARVKQNYRVLADERHQQVNVLFSDMAKIQKPYYQYLPTERKGVFTVVDTRPGKGDYLKLEITNESWKQVCGDTARTQYLHDDENGHLAGDVTIETYSHPSETRLVERDLLYRGGSITETEHVFDTAANSDEWTTRSYNVPGPADQSFPELLLRYTASHDEARPELTGERTTMVLVNGATLTQRNGGGWVYEPPAN